MLEFQQVSKQYTKNGKVICALDDVTLTIEPGQLVTLHGPSGAGKSTLLLIAGILLHPDTGQVSIDGQQLRELSASHAARFRAERIGFVFQQFHLVPYLTVRDNILAPAAAAGAELRRTAPQRADELIEQFGLTDRKHHTPGELSTGECQRTALARAMLNRPAMILADEPTGNLDPDNGRIVMTALSEFAKSGGTVMVVTHEQDVHQFADRTIQLVNGALQA